MKLLAFFIIGFLVAVPPGSSGNEMSPDLIVVNAVVRTMDASRPKAEALAIYGNKIAAVGSTKQIQALAGEKTRAIDAAGKLVLPGFNDSHVHFLMGGFSLSNVDLRDAKSPAEFARRIADFAKKIPKGQWIVEGNWDHEKWPGTPLPTKEMIDALTPEHPVFVSRTDGHMALANSLAMKLAAVHQEVKDPPGGSVVRDPKTGELTGIFKDAAMDFVSKAIPEKSFAENLAAARAATDYAASLGVTSVQDMSAGSDVGIYQFLMERGELKTRVYAVRSILSWETLANAGVRAAFGNDLLRIGGLKGFADGSLGSSTALFFEPYNDEPGVRGLLGDQMFPEGAMLKRVLGADKAGLQVMIHAIGEEANMRILDIYQTVAGQNGERDRRFRIEHAQHLRKQRNHAHGRSKSDCLDATVPRH